MSIRKTIPEDIRRASKVIGLAAWLDDPIVWAGVAPVLVSRLTLRERVCLATVALAALPDDDFESVVRSATGPQERGVAA